MNTLTSAPTSLPAPRANETLPVPLLMLRVILLLGLSVIFSLIAGLVLFSLVPLFHEAFSALVTWSSYTKDKVLAGVFTIALIVFVISGVLFTAHRLKLRSWWWIIGGYLAAAPVLAFLATDDPSFRHPVTVEELAPAFPGAEKSFEVLMRYGKLHPLGQSFSEPPSVLAGKNPRDGAAWQEVVLANRATFESRWAQNLAPVRAWWAELNAFERIGDLTPTATDAEILSFHPVRAMSQNGCAIATLLALDGKGDEAIDTEIPLIQVGRKLQPSARTLVRAMMAIVVERMALETAGFVLDHASVSPAARARLAAALPPTNPEAGARRLLLIDYVQVLGGFGERPLGDVFGMHFENNELSWIRHPLNWISPFVYNPHKTLNLYGDYITDLAELLARREMAKFEPREAAYFEREARPRFKNFMGGLIAQTVVPAYKKVSAAYWMTQDTRAKLVERVTSR